jgi:hypothetical protein
MDRELTLVEHLRRGLDDGTLPTECPLKVTFTFHIWCYGRWLAELMRRGWYRPA